MQVTSFVMMISQSNSKFESTDWRDLYVYVCGKKLQYSVSIENITVKPPKRGQFGTGSFVLSSEVVLSKRSTIFYHIFCINVHIQGTTTSK